MRPETTAQAGELDPVCGMTVIPAAAAGRAVHAGRTYYFCSPGCVERFRQQPEQFLGAAAAREAGPAAADTAAANGAAEYTCPMHPEVVQSGPGTCPICGMALEPRVVTSAEPERNPELDDMTRRFRVSLALSLPLLALAMAEMAPGLSAQAWVYAPRLRWAQLALATPVVIWGGWPFFQRGWVSR